MSEPAPGFRVSARAADGIIEAVESAEYKSMLGVQWHPECMTLAGDDSMLPLFRWLVGEAQSFSRAKAVHTRIVTLDSPWVIASLPIGAISPQETHAPSIERWAASGRDSLIGRMFMSCVCIYI